MDFNALRPLPARTNGIAGTVVPPVFQARQTMISRRLTLSDLCREPFRFFFPAAVLAGFAGVLLWPLFFGGVLEAYPGPAHTRLMGQGFFGGFIFGFLGTALPRMLSVPPLRPGQWILCCGLFLAFMVAHLFGKTFAGDAAFLLLLIVFLAAIGLRILHRRDVPPPGFVLVGLAFVCALAGTVIGLLSDRLELDTHWLVLRPLLAYQGFVLLPILGAGAFILPKFLGVGNRHDFPASIKPPGGWWVRAGFALATGLAIIASFVIEVEGWFRTAYGMRALAAAVYLFRELQLHKVSWKGTAIGWALRCGLAMIVLGLLAAAVLPVQRIALLHILLVGGLGVITIVVATRVVFGHSGNGPLLFGPNRWMWISLGLILLGMATRISGDFLPHIMASHYNYGALCWLLGMGLWAWKVLPKVLVADEEQGGDFNGLERPVEPWARPPTRPTLAA